MAGLRAFYKRQRRERSRWVFLCTGGKVPRGARVSVAVVLPDGKEIPFGHFVADKPNPIVEWGP